MKQGTEEWKLARCGLMTASRISDIMAKTKSGHAASRKNYLAELLVERLTGEPTDGFTSTAMQWGTDHEAEARAVYEFETGSLVEEVGFLVHPNLPYAGASPDGLVGDNGMAEFKCPNTATHIETLLSRAVPKNHFTQMQWQMECSKRKWCDYVSYDPRMKDADLVLFIQRVDFDADFIAMALSEVEAAEKDLNEMIEKIRALRHD